MTQHDERTQKLISDMRRLCEELENESDTFVEAPRKIPDFEAHTRHLIESQPDVFGKGGKKRWWLERWAEEHGVDPDYTWGIDDGEMPGK